MNKKFFETYKLKVASRNLLIVAFVAWTIAGIILFGRGMAGLLGEHYFFLRDAIIAILLGFVFFLLLFSRIAAKHINRIFLMKDQRPFILAFFDKKGWIMMFSMITMGITLRKLNIINHELLFSFYITMGTPLIISAIRFLVEWFSSGDNNS